MCESLVITFIFVSTTALLVSLCNNTIQAYRSFPAFHPFVHSFILTLAIALLIPFDYDVFAQDSSGIFSTSITEKAPDYNDAYLHLKHLEVGKEQGKLIEEISFSRDVGKFKLYSGEIFFCEPFNEKVSALYFEGKGEFYFQPPTKIEQEQLFRFYETKEFKKEFNKLLILFADSTYFELRDKIVAGNLIGKPRKINREILKRIEYLENSDVGYTHSDYLRSLLSNTDNGFFYAHIERTVHDPVFFQINPYAEEEVLFMRNLIIATKKLKEVINQFPAKENMNKRNKPNKYFLNILSYNIETTIEDNMDFSAECKIDFKADDKDQRWITLYLYSKLKVKKIIWEDGTFAKFSNMPESAEVWIKIEKEFLDGEQHWFKIYYQGDVLERNEYGWIELRTSNFWYPRPGNWATAMFVLIFHTPVEYNFVSVGDLKKKTVKDNVLTTTWMSSIPFRNASFSIGKFEKFSLKKEGLPQVNVYMSEYGYGQISRFYRQGYPSISDASEKIAADVINSLSLYQSLFGDIPIKTIKVTEIPYSHGEAFPGLVHLSWTTYRQVSDEGFDEIFRAHEVAHQWWGIGVDFDSYHDQWLSEGFAQYSGLWYLQVIKDDNERFFEILEDWRDEIIDNRSYLIGSGQEAGPIWLGYRTNSTATEGDYDLIIYKKGAWVLHMLRAMLLDIETMKEESFKNLIKEYFENYFGKNPTTEDFKKIVDKHFGEDMSWFFDQYVYGTDIPTYKFAYNTRKGNDGTFIVTCRVEQEEVSENFRMYVPLKILFDDENFTRMRFEISGKQKVFELPPLPSIPDEIIFNDLESVLCKVDYEDWK
ncbi:MAG: hypothetical protein JSW63_12910 [Ignavibacterium sp.]|nr:MAG: hypothetical protein JSW63_12910 [Ignavibacterium sp.]